MSNSKTWLEVSLNGPWSRDRQPLIPISVAEIVEQGVACAQAGAAIIHVHAYDEHTGRQKDDADTYAAIIEGIREHIDVIVYPHAAILRQQRFAQTNVSAGTISTRRGTRETRFA